MTLIEFVNDEAADPNGPHRMTRVLVNGSEVRVERGSIVVPIREGEPTAVTMTLLPSEVRFTNRPGHRETTFQVEELERQLKERRHQIHGLRVKLNEASREQEDRYDAVKHFITHDLGVHLDAGQLAMVREIFGMP